MALSELVARLMRLARSGQPVATAFADRRLNDALEAAAAGNHDRACAICEEMAERFPRHAAGHRLLGMLRVRSGEPGAALPHLERAASLAPDWPDTHLALGNVQQLLRNAPAAEASYRKALSLDPAAAGAHYNLALLLRSTGRRNEALQAFRRAHELDPGRGETTWDLVQDLLDIGGLDEARAASERTLALGVQSAGSQKARGLTHLFVHETPQALECFRRATAMAPADAEAWLHAGLAARELGQLEEALIAYEQVLTLRPGDVLARWHRSLVLLLQGLFERAWPDYEARLLSETWPRPGFPQPRWQGEALAGKTLLVHAEQGLGDEIMFASCLPEVISQAGRSIIDCHPKLVSIFERSFPAASVHGGHQSDDPSWLAAYPAVDYQIPIGSLALHTRRSAGDFPRHSGYLRADPRKVAAWQERLAGLGAGAKVGLSWQGGTQASRGRLRSMTLEQLLLVLRVKGVSFVDLQYTDTAAERARLEADHGVRLTHWPDALTDYDDTAALVCALDLTLSVCTSIVHLAGALGRPAWVMTPYSAEWRYGCAGEAMAWHPSVKLVRQRRYGEWEPVIAAVAADLARLAACRPGGA